MMVIIIELYCNNASVQPSSRHPKCCTGDATLHVWPGLPSRGQGDRSLAANQCQMAPPTAAQHPLTSIRVSVRSRKTQYMRVDCTWRARNGPAQYQYL